MSGLIGAKDLEEICVATRSARAGMLSPVQGRFLVAPRTEAEDDALVDFLRRKETHWLDSAECKRGVPGLEHLDDNQLLVGNPLRNPSPRPPCSLFP